VELGAAKCWCRPIRLSQAHLRAPGESCGSRQLRTRPLLEVIILATTQSIVSHPVLPIAMWTTCARLRIPVRCRKLCTNVSMAIIDPPISAILPAELRCEEISKRHVEHFVGDTVNAAKPLDYGFGRSSGARSRNCAIQPSLTVSTGSAFTSATFEPSHVLSAMGLPADQANASVRFSFGRSIRRTPRTPFDREERTRIRPGLPPPPAQSRRALWSSYSAKAYGNWIA
jgi:hypothetical protein